MNLVIDASVVIKFYVPEILSNNAEEILSRAADGELLLYAPDLVYPETGNILWKKQRLRELTPEEVDEILNAITALPMIIESSKPIMPLAVSMFSTRRFCGHCRLIRPDSVGLLRGNRFKISHGHVNPLDRRRGNDRFDKSGPPFDRVFQIGIGFDQRFLFHGCSIQQITNLCIKKGENEYLF